MLDRRGAVGAGLLVADSAEALAHRGVDVVAAQGRAERVRADAHEVAADGLALVHRVEGRDRGDLGGRDLQDLRAERDPGAGDIALDVLDEVQQRQQGRPRLRVAGDDRRGPVAHIVEHRGVDRGLLGAARRRRPASSIRAARARRAGCLRLAGVEVADAAARLGDRLAVELEDQPEHAVGRRVLRTHVDDDALVRVGTEVADERVPVLTGDGEDAALGRLARLGAVRLRVVRVVGLADEPS